MDGNTPVLMVEDPEVISPTELERALAPDKPNITYQERWHRSTYVGEIIDGNVLNVARMYSARGQPFSLWTVVTPQGAILASTAYENFYNVWGRTKAGEYLASDNEHAFKLDILLGPAAVPAPRQEASAALPPPSFLASTLQLRPTIDTLRYHWTRTEFNGNPLFRPTILLVTSWDEVWVTDVGDRAVYRWSVDGEELSPVGRNGAGPGEYVAPGVLVDMGEDSVGVWDRQLQRMSFFDKLGEFLSYREIALSIDSHGFMTSVGFRNDTSLVMSSRNPGAEPNPADNTAVLWRFVGNGPRADSLLSIPTTHMTTFREGNYRTRYMSPFTPHAYAFMIPDGRTIVGYGGRDELVVYDSAMQQSSVMPLGLPSLPVTKRNRDAFVDSLSVVLEENIARSGAGPSDRALMRTMNRRVLRELDFPSVHPRYTDAFVGQDDLLWVRLATDANAQHHEWRGYDVDTFSHTRTVYIPADGLTLNTRTDGSSFFVTMQDELGQSYLAKYGNDRR